MMVHGLASRSGDVCATEDDYAKVSSLLGRPPRGLRAVAVRSSSGDPVVIQVSSLVDNKPFPTLFWLVDKKINYTIDQLEAAGFIAQLQAQIDDSETLQEAMADDHRAHIALRNQLMLPEQVQLIEKLGFTAVLNRRGIGGIENFTRIRCLHTYYAAHLVVPNSVGKILDAHWQENNATFDHLH